MQLEPGAIQPQSQLINHLTKQSDTDLTEAEKEEEIAEGMEEEEEESVDGMDEEKQENTLIATIRKKGQAQNKIEKEKAEDELNFQDNRNLKKIQKQLRKKKKKAQAHSMAVEVEELNMEDDDDDDDEEIEV